VVEELRHLMETIKLNRRLKYQAAQV